MAKKWIKGAINPEKKGVFRSKAEAAGKTTREFASEHSGDSGVTGEQARLAQNLMSMHHGKSASRYKAKED